MAIILAVLVIYGLGNIFGKVKVSDNRGVQIYFGCALLLLAVVLFFLGTKFPHG
jgi:hypothetical protein